MMLTASVPPSSSARRLGQQPVLAPGPAVHAAGQQLGCLLAGQQPLARQVLLAHRRAVLARDDEARGELARLGGQQLVDRLGAQQRRRRAVGVDELAAGVVHGDRLGERVEDQLEPLARAAQLGDQLRVGEPARGALGERLEERELLLGRRPRRRQAQPERAQQLLGDQQRHVDPVRELHRGELLGLGVVVRERAQRLGRHVGDQPRAALAQRRDRDVDLLARRLPAGEEGGARRPGRALVVGGQPPRLALLVDDVERARVSDPRHQQRHERVDALVRPARAVGQPLDRHQQLEPLVALAQAERRDR